MQRARTRDALLIIDMINTFRFKDGLRLRDAALSIAPTVARLRQRARTRGVPVIYVNDNFTEWTSDFRQLVEKCARPRSRGHAIVARLRPTPEDSSVLKPRHSAFYQTPLPLLLEQLGSERLVLVGIATESCILSSAADAHVRGYRVTVPRDGVASCIDEDRERALAVMRDAFDVASPLARHVRFP
ncbi:cysteine hydrolase family protein [Marilutibacter chinensis]|uniref:Cysteine hydrolase n=1 Tax=Marilutibacter chinensis TaxID=2912247 RepID=A0ABS9HV11_9GAMM|nr:isochorismatase family cysteine hydrolase [Lysobacter chinensis]MCF7222222.1 cysteine hydrolase [Lysobacter chinensis]